jgi:hypothetical protein
MALQADLLQHVGRDIIAQQGQLHRCHVPPVIPIIISPHPAPRHKTGNALRVLDQFVLMDKPFKIAVLHLMQFVLAARALYLKMQGGSQMKRVHGNAFLNITNRFRHVFNALQ